MKKLLLLPVALLVLGIGVACSESLDASTPEATSSVSVEDNKFVPRVIEVPVGTEVVWTFNGRSPHNVVGDDWSSEIVSSGEFRHRFDAAGTYDYKCTLHGGMNGRVIVNE